MSDWSFSRWGIPPFRASLAPEGRVSLFWRGALPIFEENGFQCLRPTHRFWGENLWSFAFSISAKLSLTYPRA